MTTRALTTDIKKHAALAQMTINVVYIYCRMHEKEQAGHAYIALVEDSSLWVSEKNVLNIEKSQ